MLVFLSMINDIRMDFFLASYTYLEVNKLKR